MSKYGAMILVNGKRELIRRERFLTPEMKDYVKSLSEQVLNKSLEMSQAGHQIYRKLNLTPPGLQGCHWMFKSAARFNKIEPWSSHKLRTEKSTDPIKLTVDGIKLRSEITKPKRKPSPKKFVKLKNGHKIPVSEVTTDEMSEFITGLCQRVNGGSIGEMEAGREVYQKLNIKAPSSGTFWIFKQIAKLNKIEPWFSQNLRTPKEKSVRAEPQHSQAQQIQLPNDFLARIKNLEAASYSFEQMKEEFNTLQAQFKDMKVSLDLVMDSISKIHATEGIHVTAENDKEIVLRVPTNLFFKQAAVVEDVKIEKTVKGKKIVIVGPESTQIRNLTERLPGAIISFFTGKDVQERDRLIQKCENADLIVVWPRFTGHWATECTSKFKEKYMTTRSAGVRTSVDEILERLKWN